MARLLLAALQAAICLAMCEFTGSSILGEKEWTKKKYALKNSIMVYIIVFNYDHTKTLIYALYLGCWGALQVILLLIYKTFLNLKYLLT